MMLSENLSFQNEVFNRIPVDCLHRSHLRRHVSQEEHASFPMVSATSGSPLAPSARKAHRRESPLTDATGPLVHWHRCWHVRKTLNTQKGYQGKTFLDINGTRPEKKKRLPRAGLDCESHAHRTFCKANVTVLEATDFPILIETINTHFTTDKVMLTSP